MRRLVSVKCVPEWQKCLAFFDAIREAKRWIEIPSNQEQLTRFRTEVRNSANSTAIKDVLKRFLFAVSDGTYHYTTPLDDNEFFVLAYRALFNLDKGTRKSFVSGTKCARCGTQIGLETDHIIPFAIVGEDFYATINRQTLCKKCNAAKGTHCGEKEVKLFMEKRNAFKALV